MCIFSEGCFEKWDEKYWKQGDAKILNDEVAEGIAQFFRNYTLTLTTFLEAPLH